MYAPLSARDRVSLDQTQAIGATNVPDTSSRQIDLKPCCDWLFRLKPALIGAYAAISEWSFLLDEYYCFLLAALL